MSTLKALSPLWVFCNGFVLHVWALAIDQAATRMTWELEINSNTFCRTIHFILEKFPQNIGDQEKSDAAQGALNVKSAGR